MLVEQRTGFVELPRAPSCVVMSAGMLVQCVQERCARMLARMLVRRVDDAWRTTHIGELDSVIGRSYEPKSFHMDTLARAVSILNGTQVIALLLPMTYAGH